MKLYLFAIGGSGTRVVKSFVHLMASGSIMPKGTEIIPVIIDTDAQSKETINLNKTITKYNDVQKVLFNGEDDYRNSSKFFNCIISTKQFNFESLNLNMTFKQFLNEYPGQANALPSDYKYLLESLYDSSPENNPDTELNLNLNVGFKGNPNIGGIIFNMLEADENFANLLKSIKAEDRIFIISSIFGGNGSSGFPAIMNLIHNAQQNDIKQAKKGALTVLPYYDVKTPEGGIINGKLFNSKSKSALSFYIKDNVLNSLDAHYYVADGKRGQYEYSEGGASQENQASFVEFMGALSIFDFINKREFNSTENKFGFALDMVGTELGDNIIHLGHFKKDDPSYINVFKNLIEFAFAKKYFDLLSKSKSDVPTFSVESGFFSDKNDSYRYILNEYFGDWQSWIDQLENVATNKRGLKFFAFNRELDELINNTNKFNREFSFYTKSLIENFENADGSYKPYKFLVSLSKIAEQLASTASHPSLQ